MRQRLQLSDVKYSRCLADCISRRVLSKVRQLQEPPSPDDAVLMWMATLREDCPSPETPRAEQLTQALQQRPAALTTAAVEEGHPISSVRAAARRIEGQLAGRGPPAPGGSLCARCELSLCQIALADKRWQLQAHIVRDPIRCTSSAQKFDCELWCRSHIRVPCLLAGDDMLLRNGYSGLPQGAGAAPSAAGEAASEMDAGGLTPAQVPSADGETASAAHQDVVLQAPSIAAEESAAHQITENDGAQPSAATAQLAGADSAAALELEDDEVPELPRYEVEDVEDDGEGTEEEEPTSEHQSEPVSPSRPPYGSHSAPVTPAKAGKKGWSFKRMFSSGSKRRKGGAGEGIEDDSGGGTLPAARSISAGDLSGSLTTPRKAKGGRLARMLGRKRQVRFGGESDSDPFLY